MQCKLEAFYKGLREIPSGSFVNSNGDSITYNKFYKIRFDTFVRNNLKEIELKIPNEIALNLEQNYHLKVYDKIVFNLDITIFSNSKIYCKIVSVEKK